MVHAVEMGGSLAGRTAEAEVLRGFVRSARSGQAPVVFVTGEAGAGKTALAEHVLAEPGLPAEPGLVLRGRAAEWHSVAYQPIADALRPAIASGSSGSGVLGGSGGPGPVPGILAVILPELGAPPPDVSLPAVAEAVCTVLARAAAGGLAVIFIDDLQWADQATLDLFPALADAARERPLLLAACYRTDELPRDHRLRQVRAELRRRQQLAEISLAPLDPAAVRAMLADLLGAEPEPDLATAIADRADGVPFAIQELAFALRDGGRLTYQEGTAADGRGRGRAGGPAAAADGR